MLMLNLYLVLINFSIRSTWIRVRYVYECIDWMLLICLYFWIQFLYMGYEYMRCRGLVLGNLWILWRNGLSFGRRYRNEPMMIMFSLFRNQLKICGSFVVLVACNYYDLRMMYSKRILLVVSILHLLCYSLFLTNYY